MAKERRFFEKGLFDKHFMDSRAATPEMTVKEKLLGFLVGPFGTLALIAVVNQLMELYYTEVFYIDQIFGVGTYLVMSWVTKVISVLCGFAGAYVIQHSYSRQGRMRPLILIGSVLSAIAGFFMFYIPPLPNAVKLVWVYFFNILYNGIGVTLFGYRTSLLTLSTRNQNDRTQINLISQISAYLLVGTSVTLIVGSILYYSFLTGRPAGNWIMLVGGVAALSLPLSLIHYFFTRERVTIESLHLEDNEELDELKENRIDFTAENRRSVRKQLYGLLHSKYWIMAFIISVVTGIGYAVSGYNLSTNFCTVILGATAENNYNLIYTIASGLPLGIGILLIYPLCKKFTVRKVTIFFSALCVLGSVVGLIARQNFWWVVAANFIYNVGQLPFIYVIGSLLYSANDEVEYKFGFRPEGTIATAITGSVMGIITGAFAGVYETGLSAAGYDAALGTAQPSGVFTWLYFIRYIVPIIEFILIIIVLIFMNLEEKLPQMQKEIHERNLGKKPDEQKS